MGWLSIEHGKAAYRADFVVHGLGVVALAAFLGLDAPMARWPSLAAHALLGLLGWSGLEYLLHRFVLHGLQPFRGWHARHHARPGARISVPTLLSASLIAGFLFLPAWALGDRWSAAALTLGLTTGYLAYSIVHHGLHHWRAVSPWLVRRQRWHARHHHHAEHPDCFGVTTAFWDRLLGTCGAPLTPRAGRMR